jgi:hypothetical protein
MSQSGDFLGSGVEVPRRDALSWEEPPVLHLFDRVKNDRLSLVGGVCLGERGTHPSVDSITSGDASPARGARMISAKTFTSISRPT